MSGQPCHAVWLQCRVTLRLNCNWHSVPLSQVFVAWQHPAPNLQVLSG